MNNKPTNSQQYINMWRISMISLSHKYSLFERPTCIIFYSSTVYSFEAGIAGWKIILLEKYMYMEWIMFWTYMYIRTLYILNLLNLQ